MAITEASSEKPIIGGMNRARRREGRQCGERNGQVQNGLGVYSLEVQADLPA